MAKFVLPGATPVIASGLELSLIYSFLGVIAAEIVSGSEGLGTRMTYFANSFQADKFFAVLVILTIISTALTGSHSRRREATADLAPVRGDRPLRHLPSGTSSTTNPAGRPT